MKTIEEVYGFTKTSSVFIRGVKGALGLIGKRFSKPILDKSVDFGSRAGKKFMSGGIGDKLTIGLGGLTTGYVGLKGLDAITGAKTSKLLPQKGLVHDFGNPFHGQGYDFKQRAKQLVRNANLQPAYRAGTPRNIRG